MCSKKCMHLGITLHVYYRLCKPFIVQNFVMTSLHLVYYYYQSYLDADFFSLRRGTHRCDQVQSNLSKRLQISKAELKITWTIMPNN